MFALEPRDVRLNVRAVDKEAAIRAAGLVLVECGCIEPDYVESMLGREGEANTFLAYGVAIPHGQQKDRHLIRRTGVAVVQLSEGVEWQSGQVVRLVVGIAAKSDEHLAILSALTELLEDPTAADRLAASQDPSEIVRSFAVKSEGPVARAVTPAVVLKDGKLIDVAITGAAGLHARPATFFVEVAKRFGCEITVEHAGKSGNGKSMASLLKLGVAGGATIRIFARGADADEALLALRDAIECGLGETGGSRPESDLPTWIPESGGRAIGGVAAAPGLAIGPLHHFYRANIVVEDRGGEVLKERAAFEHALAVARAELEQIYETMKTRAGKNEAAIFRAHRAFLEDEALLALVRSAIDEDHSAAWAWQRAIELLVAELGAIEHERSRGRAADLHDVGRRVLRILAPAHHGETRLPEEPVILVADDLTPSDTAKLDPRKILGICTVAGGPTSHTAIIARSLDIPAVVGAGAVALDLSDGLTVILDGGTGNLYIEPSRAELESARAFQQNLERLRDEEHSTRAEPARMTDGRRVEVAANIGKATEAALAVEAGAEGVGLLRTEFLFLARETAPSEEEHYEAYAAMIRALNGLPLVIRTLDIGGDKVAPYVSLPKEDNPVLGLRGVRLALKKAELFVPQLRAIYRASTIGPVSILFPMIASLDDLRAAKELAERVRLEVGAPPVKLGIMIEVPSAVMIAAELAKECDFFSIGTNDLAQYALAIDRSHPTLGKYVDGLHPAVLRLIEMTVRAAEHAGRAVGVCGGIAGDPRGAMILAGLGATELSMSIPSVAAVKAQLRGVSYAEAAAFAKRALACGTAAEVRALPMPAIKKVAR